ncbi:MAG: nucleotidyl transferase AbiEii/AbiGii toxin family protein [Alphaproteobacteria bacterium]|nr:nucleotidyl transferase AbiEii/AbiGii toxin family protein [Alphaproteobacteria bacterium]
MRVTLTAMIANARLPIQIDNGFGDAVALQATEVTYPLLLDFPPAILKAYPPERIVAENWKR